MMGCDLNGRSVNVLHIIVLQTGSVIMLSALLSSPVQARPDHTGPDHALVCPWGRDPFEAMWFAERSLEVDIASMLLVCRLPKF